MLTNAEKIRSTAEAKLESLQLEAFSLKHTIETSYLDLRRILGRDEAEKFLEETRSLPF